MKNFFDRKYNSFAIRKFTIGVISTTLGMFILTNMQINNNYAKAENKSNISYRYVSDDELTQKEREMIVKEVPKFIEANEETYYLVYKPIETTRLSTLPNTGIHTGVGSILAAGAIGMLIIAVTRSKNKKYKILSVLLVTGLGISTLQMSANAMNSLKLSVYNIDFSALKGEKLPIPIEIPGYKYVGFIKNGYNSFRTNENYTELENEKITNFSIINPIFEKNGDSIVNLVKSEISYRDEIVETKINFSEIVEKNDNLLEGTFRIKQYGLVGKKTETIRVYTVDGKEYFRENISIKIDSAMPQIIEKGTQKITSNSENPTEQSGVIVEPEKIEKPEYTGEQSGVIVEPEKIEKPEYTGEQSGAIVESEKVEKPEYTGEQSGVIVEPEKIEKPEYTGEQSGAIVEPEKVEKPEYTGEQSGAIVEPEKVEKSEYTGEQSGAIVEPEKVKKPEYTGEQSGAIVEPEKVEKPEYTGEQSGAIVEPEKVEKPEYTGSLISEIAQASKENTVEKNASAMLNMRFISNNIENSGTGSATFIAPNILLSVAHNFIINSKDNMTGELIGSEKENIYEWITPDGKKGTFKANDIYFYNKKDYPKGYINDLAVIRLSDFSNNQYVNLTVNYNKVNVGDKLNVYGYPKGQYTHLKDVLVELEQQYAKNTYGVQYQGGAPGMSGGAILNHKGEVIGIHQNGGQNRSGGLILSPNQLEWIKSIINGKEITPKYDEIERYIEDKKEEMENHLNFNA